MERNGVNAVRMLRQNKLSKGLPFMINSKSLPSGQCYLEYPDGVIKLVTIDGSLQDFKIIRELDPQETERLRKRYRIA